MAIQKYDLNSSEDLKKLGFSPDTSLEDAINVLTANPNNVVLRSGIMFSGMKKLLEDESLELPFSHDKFKLSLQSLSKQQLVIFFEKLLERASDLQEEKEKEMVNTMLTELGLGEEKGKEEDILNLNSAKGTEKIIYLHELGILDYLRKLEPFNLSTMKLATVLSAITGENANTIQSYINPLLNENVIQRNNPLNSTNKVEAIKHTLTQLGFKPTK